MNNMTSSIFKSWPSKLQMNTSEGNLGNSYEELNSKINSLKKLDKNIRHDKNEK